MFKDHNHKRPSLRILTNTSAVLYSTVKGHYYVIDRLTSKLEILKAHSPINMTFVTEVYSIHSSMDPP